MAPDSRLWRHQLGEAQKGLRRVLPKIAVPFCLILVLVSSHVEARTEATRDSWSEHSAQLAVQEKPTQGDTLMLASLPPAPSFFNSSPAGRWSSRIQIPIKDQPSIQKFVRFYEEDGRRTFKESLERSRAYVPIMTEILECHGVPPEMISVVMVESSFRRHASNRGADGYWQLLAPTARAMGLRVDNWVDERRDPIKSTRAAAKYLRSFYEQFDSWTLALAAYNAGGGSVQCALKRGRANDFWELSKRGSLPWRTRQYVPKVLAAMHIMQNLETHGFKSPSQFANYDYESIWVQAPLKLEEVAQWVNVPVTELQNLNPSLRLDRVPPDSGYALRLPSGGRDKFDIAFEDYLRK